jgi:hypothetical protein
VLTGAPLVAIVKVIFDRVESPQTGRRTAIEAVQIYLARWQGAGRLREVDSLHAQEVRAGFVCNRDY